MPQDGTAGGAAPLSDYEKRRLANIARNQRVLGNFGIDAAAVRKAVPAAKPRARRPVRAPVEGWRRSSRLEGVDRADYKEPSSSVPWAAPLDAAEDLSDLTFDPGEAATDDDGEGARPPAAKKQRVAVESEGAPNSIKNLNACLGRLDREFLGEHIPAYQSTQIKAG
jgi:hypothetical protein